MPGSDDRGPKSVVCSVWWLIAAQHQCVHILPSAFVGGAVEHGVRHAPYGLFGGEPGQRHRNRLRDADSERELGAAEVGVPMKPGARLIVESSGGGGYGDPQHRLQPLREAIIVNARLAVVAPLPDLPTPPRAAQTQHSGPKGERRIWLGSWLKVPVYDFDTLPPDMQIEGPAIFESATTTVLLRQAETVRVTPQGWLDVQLGASA